MWEKKKKEEKHNNNKKEEEEKINIYKNEMINFKPNV